MTGRASSAVIAGASSGLGAATARALADAGHHVHLLARRRDELAELADALGGTYEVVDVTEAAAMEAACERVGRDLPPVSIAVYAAGVLRVAAIDGHPVETWREVVDVNLTGAFLFARGMAPHLDAGSRIAFISSVSGAKGQPNLAAYAASKGGLNRMAESLAAELEERGVGVHVVAPGPVATPLLDVAGAPEFQLEPEQVAEIVVWLAGLPPDVVLREIMVRAVTRGPFAHDRSAGPLPGSTHDRRRSGSFNG